MADLHTLTQQQHSRNKALLDGARYLSQRVVSEVLPLRIDVGQTPTLEAEQVAALEAVQIDAAEVAIRSLASLAEIGELDHLGGGLELIPALSLSLALADFERTEYTIEHAHTSVGYFSTLAAYGYVDASAVVEEFRRGLDIPGHVSWLPGGTQLNGGRLGVMVPVAVGQALGKQALYGEGSWVICHCGDAGWVSGQALNGFNAADLHRAPITFVMNRNGIQLSGATRDVLDKDPRPIVSAMGVSVIEIPSLHDTASMYAAFKEGYDQAQSGRPTMIYPTGLGTGTGEPADLASFGTLYGIGDEVAEFAAANGVGLDTEIWIPGSLMSFRDIVPMLECLFLVNGLPGGAGHHDGHMKGRDAETVLANPMFRRTPAQSEALAGLQAAPARQVTTDARPAPGSPNLVLTDEALKGVSLPAGGESASARAGSEAGYAAVAEAFPERVFVVSCDLDASTKLAKARSFIDDGHQFEMGIQEQVSALVANGLATSTHGPQLNVFSTFAAFFEGIAREGFDMWQYQRNLTGVNEGLNVVYHLSHVGACTGRDHFSGWGLDWVNVGLNYLPYLHRFYAPADARAAFLAVKDLAAHYGGHMIGVPRDNLPVLSKQDGSGPLWEATDAWTPVTTMRTHQGARKAILVLGAPAFLAAAAADTLTEGGTSVDVHIVNGLPVPDDQLQDLVSRYEGIVTVEDGKIGTPETGLKGFAGLISSAAGKGTACGHVGITDPRVAPSEGHMETWAHFGITEEGIVSAVSDL